jgi:hypothetical protein
LKQQHKKKKENNIDRYDNHTLLLVEYYEMHQIKILAKRCDSDFNEYA